MTEALTEFKIEPTVSFSQGRPRLWETLGRISRVEIVIYKRRAWGELGTLTKRSVPSPS